MGRGDTYREVGGACGMLVEVPESGRRQEATGRERKWDLWERPSNPVVEDGVAEGVVARAAGGVGVGRGQRPGADDVVQLLCGETAGCKVDVEGMGCDRSSNVGIG